MRKLHAFTLVFCAACADPASFDSGDGTDTGCEDVALGEPSALERSDAQDYTPVGSLWGPCDLTGVDSPDWWGCEGSLGVGLACARPVNDPPLSICFPQLTPPVTSVAECDTNPPPFGLGPKLVGGTYCLPSCETDADCGGGKRCSAASKICAWVTEP